MNRIHLVSALAIAGTAVVGCDTAPKSTGHHAGHHHGGSQAAATAPDENPTTTINDARTAKTTEFLEAYTQGDFGPAGEFFAEDVVFYPNSGMTADTFTLEEWYPFVEMHHEGFGDIAFEPMHVQTTDYPDGTTWTHVWSSWNGVNKATDEPFSTLVHLAYKWDGDRVVEEFQFFDAGKFEAEMAVALGDRFAADAPSPWDWVTGIWRVSGGDLPDAMVNWTQPTPGVDVVLGDWTNTDGVRTIQMVGWDPSTGTITSQEYGSDGSSLLVECDEFPSPQAMSGVYHMRMPDGTVVDGVVEIVRERDDLMLATLIADDGTEVVRTFEPAAEDDEMRASLGMTATTSDAKSEMVRQIHRNYEAGNLDALGPAFADDCVFKWGDHTAPADKATWRAGLGVHHDTFQDIRVDNLYVQTGDYSDGNTWTTSWLEWNGVNKATGEPAAFLVHTAHRWDGDLIVEEEVFFDIGRFQDHVEAAAAANGK